MDAAACLHHQLRNSLNTISVNAELLNMLLKEGGEREAISHCVVIILAECKRCAAALNDASRSSDADHPAEPRDR